jgi:hypothetical protein
MDRRATAWKLLADAVTGTCAARSAEWSVAPQ